MLLRLHSVARSHVDVALRHPIKLIANALGSPPIDVIEQVHAAGVPVAALAGSAKHALAHVRNGVDIISPRATRPAGTPARSARWCCGRRSSTRSGTPRCWPRAGSAPAARSPPGWRSARRASGWALAFLTAAEYDLGVRTAAGTTVVQEAMLAATSADTVRRRIYTGKPARLLKSRWTDAWDADNAPEPLPMPLQNILVSEAHQRDERGHRPDRGGDAGRPDRRPDERNRPVAEIMAELVAGFEQATRRVGRHPRPATRPGRLAGPGA